MSRYLRRTKPTVAGTVVRIGPPPTADRVALDRASWHVRLAGWNGGAAPGPAEPVGIVRPGWGQQAAA